MRTPADDELPEPGSNEDGQTAYRFLTRFGSFKRISDLPPTLRALLEESLGSEEIPAELRALLEAELAAGEDLREQDSQARRESFESYREQIWDILDSAFPTDPHLWQAAAALFTLSPSNPEELDAEMRAVALTTIGLHLQRHAKLTIPTVSPVDQLVEKFRQQMDDI